MKNKCLSKLVSAGLSLTTLCTMGTFNCNHLISAMEIEKNNIFTVEQSLLLTRFSEIIEENEANVNNKEFVKIIKNEYKNKVSNEFDYLSEILSSIDRGNFFEEHKIDKNLIDGDLINKIRTILSRRLKFLNFQKKLLKEARQARKNKKTTINNIFIRGLLERRAKEKRDLEEIMKKISHLDIKENSSLAEEATSEVTDKLFDLNIKKGLSHTKKGNKKVGNRGKTKQVSQTKTEDNNMILENRNVTEVTAKDILNTLKNKTQSK